MKERLKIFNGNYVAIGEALREEVHLKGYWHEVFHCWVIEKIATQWHIYLQLRSKSKKDYPGQYDITAAGHLLSTETIEDGVRELQEELGIDVAYTNLIALGVIPYSIDNESIKDYEFANVFVYEITDGMDKFSIQKEELDGIYCAKLDDFIRLAKRDINEIEITGYEVVLGEKEMNVKRISLEKMSALPAIYLDELIFRLENKIEK